MKKKYEAPEMEWMHPVADAPTCYDISNVDSDPEYGPIVKP